jgi:hypothetical protein
MMLSFHFWEEKTCAEKKNAPRHPKIPLQNKKAEKFPRFKNQVL